MSITKKSVNDINVYYDEEHKDYTFINQPISPIFLQIPVSNTRSRQYMKGGSDLFDTDDVRPLSLAMLNNIVRKYNGRVSKYTHGGWGETLQRRYRYSFNDLNTANKALDAILLRACIEKAKAAKLAAKIAKLKSMMSQPA